MADERIRLEFDVDDSALKRAEQTVVATTQDFYDLADAYELVGDSEADASSAAARHTASLEEKRQAVRRARMSAEEYIASQIKLAEGEDRAAAGARRMGISMLHPQMAAQQLGYALGDLGQTSGDLSQKFMAVTNNIQFMLMPLGTWGVVIGTAAVAVASLARNWNEVDRAFRSKNPFPDVARDLGDVDRELNSVNEKLDKLRGYTSLTNKELADFNRLLREQKQLEEEKALRSDLEQLKKVRPPDQRMRAEDFKALVNDVGGPQATRDLLAMFKERFKGGYGEAADKAFVDNMMANAAAGRADALEMIQDLVFTKAGLNSKLGQTIISGGSAANQLAGQSEAERAKSAEEAAKKQEAINEDLEKAKKEFGEDLFKQFEGFAERHQSMAFEKGESWSDSRAVAFRRYAQTQRDRQEQVDRANKEVWDNRIASDAKKIKREREEEETQAKVAGAELKDEFNRDPLVQQAKAGEEARKAAFNAAVKMGVDRQVAAARTQALAQGLQGEALADATRAAAAQALGRSGIGRGLAGGDANFLVSQIVDRALRTIEGNARDLERAGIPVRKRPARIKRPALKAPVIGPRDKAGERALRARQNEVVERIDDQDAQAWQRQHAGRLRMDKARQFDKARQEAAQKRQREIMNRAAPHRAQPADAAGHAAVKATGGMAQAQQVAVQNTQVLIGAVNQLGTVVYQLLGQTQAQKAQIAQIVRGVRSMEPQARTMQPKLTT